MEKINWEYGTTVSEPYVEIAGETYPIVPGVMKGSTPLSPGNLNLMQDNIEDEFENTKNYIDANIESVVKYLNLSGKTLWSGKKSTVGTITINDAKLYNLYIVYVQAFKDLPTNDIGNPIIVEHREQGDYIEGSSTYSHSRGLYTQTVSFENIGDSGIKNEQWDLLGTSKMFHNKDGNHNDYTEGYAITKIIGFVAKPYNEIKNLL